MTQINLYPKYWIIVASKDHAARGIEGGFTQACHGKAGPLRRMKKGDFMLIYSGKIKFTEPEKCQQFTAIGKVKDDDVYPFQMSPDFCPHRRNIDFFPATETAILPLINDLEFIQNKKSWGYPFRFGFFEINEHDFNLIAGKMLAGQNQLQTQI